MNAPRLRQSDNTSPRRKPGAAHSDLPRRRVGLVFEIPGDRVSDRSSSGERAGFSLVELMVASLLLGVVIATVTPLLLWSGAERRAAEQRQLAAEHLANLMEELTARPWNDIAADSPAANELPPELERVLPGAELETSVNTTDDDPPAKRIRLSLRWKGRTGEYLPPTRLTAWVYRHEEAQP